MSVFSHFDHLSTGIVDVLLCARDDVDVNGPGVGLVLRLGTTGSGSESVSRLSHLE